MSHDEVVSFLERSRTLTCATNGPRGHPHLAPLWFDFEVGQDHRFVLHGWTYRSSQKVVNLRQDDRATVQVERGDRYDELAGVVLECRVQIVEDPDMVRVTGERLAARYAQRDVDSHVAARRASKRVALAFTEVCRTSWNHAHLSPS